MSGLEAVSAAASILQLIDIGAKVVDRLNDFLDGTQGLPKVFVSIRVRLPAFVEIVRETKVAMDDNRLPDTARKAYGPLIQECSVQIRNLDSILTKLLPTAGDSKATRAWKAAASLRHDTEVNRIEAAIEKYISTMTHQGVALARNINTDPVRSKAPSPSFVNRPFARDVDFVERVALADVVARTHLPRPIARFALVGLGGVGKSQIAIEYAYRTREKSPDTWVFWVHATNVVRLQEDYRQIAKAMRIPGWDEHETDICKAVHDWLSDEAHGRWVLILDNADDMELFTTAMPHHVPSGGQSASANSTAPQIRDFLPKSSIGTILITSRDRNVAFELTGNPNHYVDVEEMNEREAITLLRRRLKGAHDEPDMIKLVEALSYMPLAISQAAAYISKMSPRVTMSSYIEDLKSSDQGMVRLLSKTAAESHRERDRSNSIVATWQLSFQHLHRVKPSAARLLSLMCLFDRQAIPETLLAEHYGIAEASKDSSGVSSSLLWKLCNCFGPRKAHVNEDPEKDSEKAASNFDDDWVTLTNFSFIKTTESIADGRNFSMHRLIQVTTAKWLEIHNEWEGWAVRFVSLVSIHCPTLGPPSYSTAEIDAFVALVPHILRALDCQLGDRDSLYKCAGLISNLALFYDCEREFTAAERHHRAALKIFENLVGRENEVTLRSLHQLGVCLDRQGSYVEAETILREAWNRRKHVLGPDHPDTLRSANMLGATLVHHGSIEEMLELSAYVQKQKQRIFGADSSEVQGGALTRRLNVLTFLEERPRHLAGAAAAQRKHFVKEKDTYSEEDIRERELLALILKLQRKNEEAEDLYREVMEWEIANVSFQYSLRTINRLAEVLVPQGKHLDAEAELRKVISKYEEYSEQWKDEALESMQNLALLLALLRRFTEAEELTYRLISEREQSWGSAKLVSLSCVHVLAHVLSAQDRYGEALVLFKKSYIGIEKVAGPTHVKTYECFKDFEKAEELVSVGGDKDRMNENNGVLPGSDQALLRLLTKLPIRDDDNASYS